MAQLLPPVAMLAALPAADPVGREQAREAAERELSEPVYHQHDPSLIQRLVLAGWRALRDFLDQAAQATPGGWLGLIAIIVLLTLAATAVLLRTGPVGRSHERSAALHVERELTAADYRDRAERAADEGDWAAAIRDRLRALSTACEERTILDPRTTRTATELATAASVAFPGQADELAAAARLFDDVWYGERPATAEGYQQVRDLDRKLDDTRPATAEAAP